MVGFLLVSLETKVKRVPPKSTHTPRDTQACKQAQVLRS